VREDNHNPSFPLKNHKPPHINIPRFLLGHYTLPTS
jgi:hypothetical protein